MNTLISSVLFVLMHVSAQASTVGDWNHCTRDAPCEVGEGHCSSRAECAPGLACHRRVGADYGFNPYMSVCEERVNGDYGYCSPDAPCASGEGHCNGDSDCDDGLACDGEGSDYGMRPWVRVCTGAAIGDWDFCSVDAPCEEDEGHCSSDDECAPHLTCSEQGDDWLFHPNMKTCTPPVQGDWAYCRIEGPCDVGEGNCGDRSECMPGLRCAWNTGADYGLSPEVDICQVDGVCWDGTTELGTTPCGLNNEGVYERTCIDDAWVDDLSSCSGLDACVNDTVEVQGCTAQGSEGEQTRTCEAGSWSDWGSCAICDDGDEQLGYAVCGLNDEGYLFQICIDGQWENQDDACSGTDVCMNGETETVACGTYGTQTQTCAEGAWQDWGACVGDHDDGCADEIADRYNWRGNTCHDACPTHSDYVGDPGVHYAAGTDYCPSVCNGGCENGTCSIVCNGKDACKDAKVECPDGMDCDILCHGEASCQDAQLVCPETHQSCDITCIGKASCKGNTSFRCSDYGDCQLYCDKEDACQDADLSCGDNACVAYCDRGAGDPDISDNKTCSGNRVTCEDPT